MINQNDGVCKELEDFVIARSLPAGGRQSNPLTNLKVDGDCHVRLTPDSQRRYLDIISARVGACVTPADSDGPDVFRNRLCGQDPPPMAGSRKS